MRKGQSTRFLRSGKEVLVLRTRCIYTIITQKRYKTRESGLLRSSLLARKPIHYQKTFGTVLDLKNGAGSIQTFRAIRSLLKCIAISRNGYIRQKSGGSPCVRQRVSKASMMVSFS